jgi:phytoene synthase
VSGRDTNFYYSFVVLPPVKRQAIIAVWDFCRAVDDAVDENRSRIAPTGQDCREQASCDIAEWRAELARCYDGHAPQTQQGLRLKPFVERFRLPRQAFEDVIDGVAMDLEHPRYETFDALYEYCLRVASAVGLICVEIFGYRDDRSRDFAVELGIALQLTNIIRDVGVDLAVGRVYLPQEDLRRFGCSEEDLRKGQVTDPVRALMRFQCDRARSYYERSQRALPSADSRALIAARIMAAIYLEILRSIERADYDVFSRVIRVPRPRRAVIAATTWAQGMVFG